MAASDVKLYFEEDTNGEGGDIKMLSSDEHTSAPQSGDNTRHVKEDVACAPEKMDKDLKVKRKADESKMHAFEDMAPCIDTYPESAAPEPRYLHIGDHIVVYSGHESEDTYGYEAPEKVSTEHDEDDPSIDYEKPEDVDGYEEHEDLSRGHVEGSSSCDFEKPEDVDGYGESKDLSRGRAEESPSRDYEKPEDVDGYGESKDLSRGRAEGSPSRDYEKPEDVDGYGESKDLGRGHNYEKPEDVHGHEKSAEKGTTEHEDESSSHDYDKPEDVDRHKDHEDVSFANKSKARLMVAWKVVKSSRVFWLVLGCGLLVVASAVIAAVLAPRHVPDVKESHHSKHEDSVMITENLMTPGTPVWTTMYMENSLVAINSTPIATTSVDADALLTVTISGNAYVTFPNRGPSGQLSGVKPRPCQSGWTGYKDHCYLFVRNRVSWFKANRLCKQCGANLASVTCAVENNFIARIITGAPKRVTRSLVWFGLRRQKRAWAWTDGTPLIYTNWAPGEPGKNFMGKAANCGNVYSKSGKSWISGGRGKKGQWNDHDCTNGHAYVCKKER